MIDISPETLAAWETGRITTGCRVDIGRVEVREVVREELTGTTLVIGPIATPSARELISLNLDFIGAVTKIEASVSMDIDSGWTDYVEVIDGDLSGISPRAYIRFRVTASPGDFADSVIVAYRSILSLPTPTQVGGITMSREGNRPFVQLHGNCSLGFFLTLNEWAGAESVLQSLHGQRVLCDIYASINNEEMLVYRGVIADYSSSRSIDSIDLMVNLVDQLQPLRDIKAEQVFADLNEEGEYDWQTNVEQNDAVDRILDTAGITDRSLISPCHVGDNIYKLLTHGAAVPAGWTIRCIVDEGPYRYFGALNADKTRVGIWRWKIGVYSGGNPVTAEIFNETFPGLRDYSIFDSSVGDVGVMVILTASSTKLFTAVRLSDAQTIRWNTLPSSFLGYPRIEGSFCATLCNINGVMSIAFITGIQLPYSWKVLFAFRPVSWGNIYTWSASTFTYKTEESYAKPLLRSFPVRGNKNTTPRLAVFLFSDASRIGYTYVRFGCSLDGWSGEYMYIYSFSPMNFSGSKIYPAAIHSISFTLNSAYIVVLYRLNSTTSPIRFGIATNSMFTEHSSNGFPATVAYQNAENSKLITCDIGGTKFFIADGATWTKISDDVTPATISAIRQDSDDSFVWAAGRYTGIGGYGLITIPTMSIYSGKSLWDILQTIAWGQGYYVGVTAGRVFFGRRQTSAVSFPAGRIKSIGSIAIDTDRFINRLKITYGQSGLVRTYVDAPSVAKWGFRDGELELRWIDDVEIVDKIANEWLDKYSEPASVAEIETHYAPFVETTDSVSVSVRPVLDSDGEILKLTHNPQGQSTTMTVRLRTAPNMQIWGETEYGG